MRACVQKMDNSLIKLSEIWIYPIKSLPGIALNSAEIDACGFIFIFLDCTEFY